MSQDDFSDMPLYVGEECNLETAYLNVKKGSKAARVGLYDRHTLALDKGTKLPFGQSPSRHAG